MSSTFKDLRVWQMGMELVFDVYRVTKPFPRDEVYGLSSQMRRAAVSIPSNIAEGKGLRTDAKFGRFLYHARASLMELQTQIMIAAELKYLSAQDSASLLAKCEGIGRSLAGLINSLEPKANAAQA